MKCSLSFSISAFCFPLSAFLEAKAANSALTANSMLGGQTPTYTQCCNPSFGSNTVWRILSCFTRSKSRASPGTGRTVEKREEDQSGKLKVES